MSEKKWGDMTADEQADYAAKGLLDRYREQNGLDAPSELDLTTGIYRYCGVQPGDDWVKRVERLNAIIDELDAERGTKPLTLDDQLRMLAEDK
jgi:hypothetical protein